MDQHEGASGSCCDQIGADHGLADARRRDEHSNVLTQKSPCRLPLDRREPAFEGDIQRLPFAALVLDEKGAAMFAKDLLELGSATAG